MKRSEAVQRLGAHRDQLRRQFGVALLAIFGSTARDEATTESDVDLLVEFDRPTGLFDLIRLQFHLEELLGTTVDVGTIDGLKPRIRECVLAESIYRCHAPAWQRVADTPRRVTPEFQLNHFYWGFFGHLWFAPFQTTMAVSAPTDPLRGGNHEHLHPLPTLRPATVAGVCLRRDPGHAGEHHGPRRP
jgi:hypothetical protein